MSSPTEYSWEQAAHRQQRRREAEARKTPTTLSNSGECIDCKKAISIYDECWRTRKVGEYVCGYCKEFRRKYSRTNTPTGRYSLVKNVIEIAKIIGAD